MGTTVIQGSFLQTYSSTTDLKTGASSYSVSPTNYLDYERVVSRPDVEHRPRPKGVDRVFSFTSRIVTERVMTDGLCTVSNVVGPTFYSTTSPSRAFVTTGKTDSGYTDPISDAAAMNRLLSMVKAKGANMVVNLAEYRQTSSMFVEYAAQVARMWRSMRRGKLPIPKNHRLLNGRSYHKFRQDARKAPGFFDLKDKAWADQWLRFQYGAYPLVNDLKDALEGLPQQPSTTLQRVSFTMHRSASRSYSASYGGNRKTTVLIEESGSHRYILNYEVNYPELARLSSYGLTTPAADVWNLIPYSFVVDWFVNVGEYLELSSALDGVGRVSACKVIRRDYKMTNGLGSVYTERLYSRQRLTPVTPQLVVEPHLSWKRIVSAVALLRKAKA
ncbi:MAG: maturation protein [Sanya fiers-like virus 50]|nr:MAG: maturation protein [Sanya fiers-like virus 50]